MLLRTDDLLGNKKDNITVIYTPWSNLKKDGSMAVGQVSFKDNKKVSGRPSSQHVVLRVQVKRIHVVARENPIVNRLNKTKTEAHPDLRTEREDRLKELRRRDQSSRRAREKEELRIARERKEKAYQRDHAYDDLFSAENVAASSNQDRGSDFEDDFM